MLRIFIYTYLNLIDALPSYLTLSNTCVKVQSWPMPPNKNSETASAASTVNRRSTRQMKRTQKRLHFVDFTLNCDVDCEYRRKTAAIFAPINTIIMTDRHSIRCVRTRTHIWCCTTCTEQHYVVSKERSFITRRQITSNAADKEEEAYERMWHFYEGGRTSLANCRLQVRSLFLKEDQTSFLPLQSSTWNKPP